MRKELIGSFLVHSVLLLFLFFFTSSVSQTRMYPQVYRVALVSFPKASSSQVTVATAKKIQPAKVLSEKNVNLKKKTQTLKKKLSAQEARKALEEKLAKEAEAEKNQLQKGFEGLGEAKIEGNFQAPYYIEMMIGKIKNLWKNPLKIAAEKVVTTIYFKIQRDGTITDVGIEKTSGVSVFDQAALRSVFLASPLPPLPLEYGQSYLGVHLEFEFAP